MKKVLGIDVGGTKIAAGLVDKKGKVSKFSSVTTNKRRLLNQIKTIINSFSGFDAVGIGMPGPIRTNGTVIQLPNIPNFKSVNLKKILEKKYKVKVNVMNDAKAFTLAEATLGAGKKYKKIAGVVMGTGIGSGAANNMRVSLKNPYAGEIGHMAFMGKQTLEQRMRNNPNELEKVIVNIISLLVKSISPDLIVFGGGRMENSRGQKALNQASKLVGNKTKVIVSSLKYAGVIGAALPLLKK